MESAVAGPGPVIIGVSPFERPDPELVAAIARAGFLGVLDVGHDRGQGLAALAEIASAVPEGFAVRLPAACPIGLEDLPPSTLAVVVPSSAQADYRSAIDVIVQATSVDEARAAAERGAAGIIAKGSESGGPIGDEGAFVLLQRIMAAGLDLPVWAQGGIGLDTAAASSAAGAAGVVLDAQLALARECRLPVSLRDALRAFDGSETTVVEGSRVHAPPGHDGVPLPIGQDAALAAELAGRFGTAGRIALGVRDAMHSGVRNARRLRPLAEGASLAARHRTRYPIAQGPMTRVSDVAGFAESVADAGGLPFLALAVMRGADARKVLEETAALLGERPWGVGILGFVSQELREEQLAAVRDVAPSVALVAGGRPAHARALEEAGVDTYLHVPSPTLLEQFLKQGVRRFVFEGRECGGHVGPRTSFLLWQSQLDVLRRHDAPEELSVMFAGGIHDGRSGAMVEAMASGLAARGASVGALMGTAYLFTDEAVAAGAITPSFRDVALATERTVLLETSPGHATRCADTEYVRAFVGEKERLEAEGATPQETWEALEQLNLGRLRLASKGLAREGGQLVAVDEETQRREGMVMIGQVAALRGSASTIAELHRDVSEGAGDALARVEVRAPAEPREARPPVDVAIVGMAAVLPGAPDLETYWSNVVGGVNSITEIPSERWSVDAFYDPDSVGGESTPSKWGGFIDDVVFDPTAYGIPPVSLAAIEPAQLLALEVSRRALADAGYLDTEFDRERTSVIFGAESGSELAAGYGFRSMWRQYAGDLPSELEDVLPRLTEDSFPGILANVIAGRIANRLDLGGVNYTVDAACAASLAALDLSVKELTLGTSDLVLCGGVDLHNGINDYLAFSAVHALSPSGQCRTFSADADGIVLGEGAVVVVLRRLADAERDGDRVYAVVKGVAGSSDGKSLGLTAPRREGQIRALERAYRSAGISPVDIGLVEAHGTGTVVGDRTELETLESVYGDSGAEVGSCALGSVKSQIGHTKCAAGLAGLVKAALALHHGVLPPTGNIESPNPAWDAESSPFSLSRRARPWRDEERNAAVSAFGFGGANFHVVLSRHSGHTSARVPGPVLHRWPAELFVIRGADAEEADARMGELASLLESGEQHELRELAYASSHSAAPVRLAIVATDVDELASSLARARAGEVDGESVFAPASGLGGEPRVAFLFPGQGSQRVGMLGDLYVAFPKLRRYLELGSEYADRMLPPTAWTQERRERQRASLTDTSVAQPALGIAGLTLASLLEQLGVRPDLVGGHSYGELVALAVAGALDEDDLVRLSARRAQAMLEAIGPGGDRGAMAAVASGRDAVEPHLEGLDRLVIANDNAPDQVVISGPTASVETAVERLDAAGISARLLPVACAFHSPLLAGAGEVFASDLAQAAISTPACPTFSNAVAAPHPDDPAGIRELLARQIGEPIRFVEQVEAMYATGARIFVEVGPGRVLTGLASRVLGERPHVATACDVSGEHGIVQLLRALATLAVNGVELDVEPLFEGRVAVAGSAASRSGDADDANLWLVNGQVARPLRGELPPHALKPVSAPVVDGVGRTSPPADGDEAVVLEYLRSTRELVAAQHEVVLGFLGVESLDRRRASDADTPAHAAAPPGPVRDKGSAPDEAREEPSQSGQQASEELSPREILLELVCERTGYPIEMLDLDLNLEADLSIDSIKRIEILGALDERLGGSSSGEVPEELVAVKTLRGILEVMERSSSPGGGGAPTHGVDPSGSAEEAFDSVPSELGRYVLVLQEAEPLHGEARALDGVRYAIVDDGRGVAPTLASLLEARGATVEVVDEDRRDVAMDCLVDLAMLRADAGPDVVKRVFERVRFATSRGIGRIVAATGLGGSFGRYGNGQPPSAVAGAAGLLRSVAKEHAGAVDARTVDLVPDADPAELAEQLLDELTAEDGLHEVGYENGSRWTLRPEPRSCHENGKKGASLDHESVVLITGGARGITARVARGLAARYGCRLELVGRTQLSSGTEPPELRDARDPVSLRRALAQRGDLGGLSQIEEICSRILAEREVRETLSDLEEAGSRVVYHAADVRDGDAFGRIIDDVYARHGRIDGVVHAAGVIEDKLLDDKTMDSFARVFDTKVAGAVTLVERLRSDVTFVCFFSSVASAFGSRGQADYAAANDVLDKLAAQLNRTSTGRVFAINWGPWGDAGMVSPELERDFERRGIGLIGATEGVASFLTEIESGGPDDVQVVLMKADLAALA